MQKTTRSCGGVLASVLLLASPSLAQQPVGPLLSSPYLSFQATAPYSPLYTRWVGARDLNGDGLLDIVVLGTSGYPGRMEVASVLLARGNGIFEPHADFGTSLPSAQSAVIGDLNGDGIEDIAVVGGPGVSVLEGRGSGDFVFNGEYFTHLGAQSIALADVNRDHLPDLVVTYASAGFVTVLFGRSDGLFFDKKDLAMPVGSKHLTLEDLNGDSIPDLVMAVAESSSVSVLPGVGDGTFGPGARLGAVSKPTDVLLSDLNRDGRSDLVVVNSDSSSVSTFLGTGDAGFGARQDWPVGPGPSTVATADFNGDGQTDMAVLNAAPSAAGSISILIGDGSGRFPTRTDLPFVRGLKVIAADLNGDGVTDLAAGSNGAAAIFPGNGDGTFGVTLDYDTEYDPRGVVSGDFDGDGFPDLAVPNRISGSVEILLGAGDGAFRRAADLNPGYYPNLAVAGDWNRDGLSDLAVTTASGVSVLLSKGDGAFQPRVEYPVGRYPQGIAAPDVNNDSFPDLIVSNPDKGALTVMLGHGDGTFESPVNTPVGSTPQSALATADFNLDGKSDAVIARYSFPASYPGFVSILLGNGDGTFGHQTDIPTAPGDNPGSIAIGDLNSDGKRDIAVTNSLGATLMTLLGAGDGTFTRAPTISYVTGPVAILDVDGDSNDDLVTGAGAIVDVRLGNGNGTFQPTQGYGVFRQIISMVAGDFNNDCQVDIAVLGHADAPSEKLWIMSNRTRPSGARPAKAIVRSENRPIQVGAGPPFFCPSIEPLPGAFDTGDIDLATVSMRSIGTGTVETIRAVSPKQTRTTDLDGDGILELPVCFTRADLAQLFSRVRGRQDVDVTIEGCLVCGGAFRAPLALTVQGRKPHPVAAIRPNPLNPVGILEYSTTRPGPVRVRLYDTSGRLVRILVDVPLAPAGEHSVVVGAEESGHQPLASGVYFYRIESTDGVAAGSFTVLK